MLLFLGISVIINFLPISLGENLSVPFDVSEQISETLYRSQCNGDVKIYSLRINANDAGHSIWFSRNSNRVRVKYFPCEEENRKVADLYQDWKTDKKVICCFPGAYMNKEGVNDSNEDYYPNGFSVDEGVIISRFIGKDRSDMTLNALVLIYPNGDLKVFNIQNSIYLSDISRYINFKNEEDVNTFFKWVEQKRITVFQTHLLAFSNSLMVQKSSQDERRERRVLISVSRNNEKMYILYNVTNKYSVYLTTFASDLFNYLRKQNFQIEFMINLDTGTGNYMETYDERWNIDKNIIANGGIGIERLLNLMVFYYD